MTGSAFEAMDVVGGSFSLSKGRRSGGGGARNSTAPEAGGFFSVFEKQRFTCMGAHFGLLLKENSIFVSAKNEVLPAWALNFHKFQFFCEFLVF